MKPTEKQLMRLVDKGQATNPVYTVSRREYVSNGVRYTFVRTLGKYKKHDAWVLTESRPELPPQPCLKSIVSLAEMGEAVAGLRVDIRPRQSNGTLLYEDQHPIPIFTTLKSVAWKKKPNGRWLYWEWEPAPTYNDHTHYSGVHESRAGEYYLEVHPS